jgi:hypothetical protein
MTHVLVVPSDSGSRQASGAPLIRSCVALNNTCTYGIVAFCQGAITTGYASDATDDAIQANIVQVYRFAALKNGDR